MPDVLIRRLSVAAVDRIAAEAKPAVSHEEYQRRRFEAEGAVAAPVRRGRLTLEDLHRAAAAAADVEGAAIMRTA